MPVFSLDEELVFPHPVLREPDGLLAVGGDLSVDRLLLAYRWGIYPWYHEGQPILWWWTIPRLMLRPSEVIISHSMRSVLRKQNFRVIFNDDFLSVMKHCGAIPRRGQDGTWITEEMIDAYHQLSLAKHIICVEVHDEDGLIGGLYGVVSGKIFSGESMFALKPNASKIAFIQLCQYLQQNEFDWIDCQQETDHLKSLGAHLIGEEEYMQILRANQRHMMTTS